MRYVDECDAHPYTTGYACGSATFAKTPRRDRRRWETVSPMPCAGCERGAYMFLQIVMQMDEPGYDEPVGVPERAGARPCGIATATSGMRWMVRAAAECTMDVYIPVRVHTK